MNKLTLLLAVACLGLAAPAARAADFYVAPGGDDAHPGTQAAPLASLATARDAARKAGAGPHRIVVRPGDYTLAQPLELDARDSGLTIEAAPGGKATLYGGRAVTGWRRDGEQFWSADLPGVREGAWDFRALVMNGTLPERARLPETGTLLHRSVFDVPWLSSVGGGWARKPTADELTTMLYDPKDIPATMDPRNAEVRVYHMWDESLLGVTRNDAARHALLFSTQAISPPGAFGVKKYVIFNTREGMTHPGQWYLDRSAGRVVYWPKPGEELAKAKAVAPVLEKIITITGTAKAPAEKITLRGLSLQATTTPLKPAGFSAGAYAGALSVEQARQCVFEKLEICNVGGQAIQASGLADCQVTDCQIHHVGACGIRASGLANLVARNLIHHVGVYHPSAVAINASTRQNAPTDKGFHLYRNEIHDTPYSGIIAGGGGHLIEENLISRVMLEMQDGGAIYGGIKNSILRGNMVRDVVKMGEGYGVSAYYLDEGARNCIVEHNVSIGVERPTHNHIARDIIIRDNVFIADKDLVLSFQRSANCTFSGNTLFVPGKIVFAQPSAIKTWEKNIVYREGLDKGGVPQAFTIDSAMPPVTPPARRANPVNVARAPKAPAIDGEIGWEEWPGKMTELDRDPSRWNAVGAPAFAKFAYDDEYLYVAVNVATFDTTRLTRGDAWGKDDGAELCLGGKTKEGQPVTFVVRGFAGGAMRSTTDAGAPAGLAEQLGKGVRFAAKPFGNRMGGWRGEWAIPFAALGVKPAPGAKIGFNLGIYRADDEVRRCLEGTLAENWRLDQATALQFK